MNLLKKLYIGLTGGLALTSAFIIGSAYHSGTYSILVNINHFGEAHIELALAIIWTLLTLYYLVVEITTVPE